jgi:Ethanolamine utilization protein EutJ (predicted chaperonin)
MIDNQNNFFSFIDRTINPASGKVDLNKTVKDTMVDNYQRARLSKREKEKIEEDLSIKINKH